MFSKIDSTEVSLVNALPKSCDLCNFTYSLLFVALVTSVLTFISYASCCCISKYVLKLKPDDSPNFGCIICVLVRESKSCFEKTVCNDNIEHFPEMKKIATHKFMS